LSNKIVISPEEKSAQSLNEINLEKALLALRDDGFIVVSDAVCHGHLDKIQQQMDKDAQKLIDAEQWSGAGGLPGHLMLGPPPFNPYVFSDIVANPFAIQINHKLLGDGFFSGLYSGNTNCPGSEKQPLHRDVNHLWPNLKNAHPAASLVVNIALDDVNEERGSIELWPGTHMDAFDGSVIDEKTEENRRVVSAPIRGNTSKGSILIRDMRLWHRGTPNTSKRLRHMIAMVHNIGWLVRGRKLTFGTGCESQFPETPLDYNSTFSNDSIDYVGLRNC
tara:strand:- start:17508 stop:18338 length:831 start_codon:yes stop_codon:yes gene_type:complete